MKATTELNEQEIGQKKSQVGNFKINQQQMKERERQRTQKIKGDALAEFARNQEVKESSSVVHRGNLSFIRVQ